MSEFDDMVAQRDAIEAKQRAKTRNAVIDECIVALRAEIDDDKERHPAAIIETCIRTLSAMKN